MLLRTYSKVIISSSLLLGFLFFAKKNHLKKHLEFLLHSEIPFKTNPHKKYCLYQLQTKAYNELKEIYELYPTISSQSKEFKKSKCLL